MLSKFKVGDLIKHSEVFYQKLEGPLLVYKIEDEQNLRLRVLKDQVWETIVPIEFVEKYYEKLNDNEFKLFSLLYGL